ncbi:MAG: hypothetical protein Q9208_002794 [Pyrenodesmia sp. 3 TL-2023]
MEALTMSKAECRKLYLQEDGRQYDKIVIGAIILKQNHSGKPEILLLKRAAHESAYPNIWEIPGGKVEDSDTTILDAVKREVSEETGMKVEQVIRAVKSFEYSMEKKSVGKDGEEESAVSSSLQLNYVCRVESYELVVDPKEHSEGKFADEEAVREMEMTEQMRAVVEDALGWGADCFAG